MQWILRISDFFAATPVSAPLAINYNGGDQHQNECWQVMQAQKLVRELRNEYFVSREFMCHGNAGESGDQANHSQ
jgi:hypothetical protein